MQLSDGLCALPPVAFCISLWRIHSCLSLLPFSTFFFCGLKYICRASEKHCEASSEITCWIMSYLPEMAKDSSLPPTSSGFKES